MTFTTINKLDIAERQLETALNIYFDCSDNISVLTLAGAAEVILARYVENQGGRSALPEIVQLVCEIQKRRCGAYPKQKPIYNRANFARNSFKHMDQKDDYEVTIDLDEEVHNMLNRAVDNYWELTKCLTPLMERYENERRSVKQKHLT